MKRLSNIIILLLLATAVKAQVAVETQLDSVQMLIGEQVHLSLSVSVNEQQQVVFPQFAPRQEMTPGVEVLEVSETDTTAFNEHNLKLTKVYTLTSFEDTLYYLPPLNVNVDGKNYQSKNLALKVLTVPVDTLHPEQFFPPKDVQDNPFSWKEWRGPFWISVVVLALMLIAFYVYVRMKSNKPIIAKVRFVRHLAPHQRAMQEIAKINSDPALRTENQKEYYTRLTDTLRVYMHDRFGFNAMEMTSDEIIAELQKVKDPVMIEELRQLFQTADLVKFAKYSTLMNEKDLNVANALAFINNTKLDDAKTVERVKPVVTLEDKKKLKNRALLRLILAVIVGVAIALLALLAWKIYILIA